MEEALCHFPKCSFAQGSLVSPGNHLGQRVITLALEAICSGACRKEGKGRLHCFSSRSHFLSSAFSLTNSYPVWASCQGTCSLGGLARPKWPVAWERLMWMKGLQPSIPQEPLYTLPMPCELAWASRYRNGVLEEDNLFPPPVPLRKLSYCLQGS